MAELPKYFYFRVYSVEHGTALRLEDASDVDVVEVVRCKDCEWWTKQDASLQGRCALGGFYPTGEWFCANGKRRPV